MKKSLINGFFMWLYVIVGFYLSNFGATLIFEHPYSKWSVILIWLAGLTLVCLGIYQLVTCKFRVKLVGGRIFGILFLLTPLLLIPVAVMNDMNKVITIGNDYNQDLIDSVKESYIDYAYANDYQAEDSAFKVLMDEQMKQYEIKMALKLDTK